MNRYQLLVLALVGAGFLLCTGGLEFYIWLTNPSLTRFGVPS